MKKFNPKTYTWIYFIFIPEEDRLEIGPKHFTDTCFFFSRNTFVIKEHEPDIICFNYRIMDLFYNPELSHQSIKNLLNENPNSILMIETLINPISIDISRFEHSAYIPEIFKNRDIIILHRNYVKEGIKLNPNIFLIHYDMAFDHYRFSGLGACQLGFRVNIENLPYVVKKPRFDEYKNRAYKFLCPNKVKPDSFKSYRHLLEEFCLSHESDVIFGNSKHRFFGGFNSDDDFDFYSSQTDRRWLEGGLNDPTVNNFLHYNSIHKTILTPAGTPEDENFNDRWIKPIMYTVNNHPHHSYYEESFCSIYAETIINGISPVISEKTWYPLSYGHFIVPFACYNSIEFLKNVYGFRFPSFIDYSYDSIEDHDNRANAYIAEINRLAEFSLDEWKQFTIDNVEILMHNIKLFYNIPAQEPLDEYYDLKIK